MAGCRGGTGLVGMADRDRRAGTGAVGVPVGIGGQGRARPGSAGRSRRDGTGSVGVPVGSAAGVGFGWDVAWSR